MNIMMRHIRSQGIRFLLISSMVGSMPFFAQAEIGPFRALLTKAIDAIYGWGVIQTCLNPTTAVSAVAGMVATVKKYPVHKVPRGLDLMLKFEGDPFAGHNLESFRIQDAVSSSTVSQPVIAQTILEVPSITIPQLEIPQLEIAQVMPQLQVPKLVVTSPTLIGETARQVPDVMTQLQSVPAANQSPSVANVQVPHTNGSSMPKILAGIGGLAAVSLIGYGCYRYCTDPAFEQYVNQKARQASEAGKQWGTQIYNVSVAAKNGFVSDCKWAGNGLINGASAACDFIKRQELRAKISGLCSSVKNFVSSPWN